jgi:two-component system chemotaxis response regulator CheB
MIEPDATPPVVRASSRSEPRRIDSGREAPVGWMVGMTESQRIRVLVVDDSTVVRRMVAKVLSDDPRIEVVGTAVNGRIALEQVASLRPDVITLDLETPVIGGLEALAELRRSQPTLPVIVFSAPNDAGAVGALEALQAGASDYVAKPSRFARVADALEALEAELIPKILALHTSAQRNADSQRSSGPAPARVDVVPRPQAQLLLAKPSASRPELVVIGTSTGGPKVLQAILPSLPERFPVPILVVQHMPPTFTATLARSLDQRCRLAVQEGFEGAAIGPGQVWIAPGDFHMTVERTAAGGVLHLDRGPKENSCRPAVDVLFRSAAKAYGARTLALVLTGMGSDGTEGARALRQVGARVAIQDEQSSVVWGMPGSVAVARLADLVLSQDEIAEFIQRSVGSSATRPSSARR